MKENQHHGHKSCRERQRVVTKEPPDLTWPAGSQRDGEELGKGNRVTAGPDWEVLAQTPSVGGMEERNREGHGGQKEGLAQREVTGDCKGPRWVEGAAWRG